MTPRNFNSQSSGMILNQNFDRSPFEAANQQPKQFSSDTRYDFDFKVKPNATQVQLRVNPDGQSDSDTARSFKMNFVGAGLNNPTALTEVFHGFRGMLRNLMGMGNNIGNLKNNKQTTSIVTEEVKSSRNFEGLDASSPSQANSTSQIASPSQTVSLSGKNLAFPNQPLIGIIDNDFDTGSHGAQVLNTISSVNDRAPTWLSRGVGNGQWAKSLQEFTQQVKESGRSGIANLSFDLTSLNQDGTISTRYQLTSEEQSALDAAEKNGILVVAAAGNEGKGRSTWESAAKRYKNFVLVGAADGQERSPISNYGIGVDLLAPVSNQDASFQGTSHAAAQVSGAAANVWSHNPHLNVQQVESVLKRTATNLDAPGWDANTGAGLLNVSAAVSHTKQLGRQTQILTGAQITRGWTNLTGQQVMTKFNRTAKVAQQRSRRKALQMNRSAQVRLA